MERYCCFDNLLHTLVDKTCYFYWDNLFNSGLDFSAFGDKILVRKLLFVGEALFEIIDQYFRVLGVIVFEVM